MTKTTTAVLTTTKARTATITLKSGVVETETTLVGPTTIAAT